MSRLAAPKPKSRAATQSIFLASHQVDLERRLFFDSIGLIDETLEEQAALRDLVGKSNGDASNSAAVLKALDSMKSKLELAVKHLKKAGSFFGQADENETKSGSEISHWVATEYAGGAVATPKSSVSESPAPAMDSKGSAQQDQIVKIGSACQPILAKINDWDFDVFELANQAQGQPMVVLSFHLFNQLDLFNQFKIPKDYCINFFRAVEKAYLDVPYHNKVHGTDVMQTTNYFLQLPSMKEHVSPLGVLAALIAAACHDMRHPGLNNQFLIATQHDIAITYNDSSVLENMHVAQAFAAMKGPNCDILVGLDAKQRATVRKMMITMILSTDMSKHMADVQMLQARTSDKNAKDWKSENDQLLLLSTILHTSDLANPAKPPPFNFKWTSLITQEFHNQGRKEKEVNLPVSAQTDPDNKQIEGGQVFFIEKLVTPLVEAFAKIAPEIIQGPNAQLASNLALWKQRLDTIKAGGTVPPLAETIKSFSGGAPVAAVGGGGEVSSSSR